MAYFHAANARGRCVADQPASANRAQLIAACGAEAVPPPNLVQYWAARNTWLDCAQPLLDTGRRVGQDHRPLWGQARSGGLRRAGEPLQHLVLSRVLAGGPGGP